MPVLNSDMTGLDFRLKSSDAAAGGGGALTAWTDNTGNGHDVTDFGTGVTVVPSAFGAGIAGVNIANSGLVFNDSSPLQTLFAIAKGGTDFTGLFRPGPIVGWDLNGPNRIFYGDEQGAKFGNLRYLSSEGTACDVWLNGNPIPSTGLNVSPNEIVVMAIRLPTAKQFNSIARELFGYFQGGRYTIGDVSGIVPAYTDGTITDLSLEFMADYNATRSLLPILFYSEGDSIDDGGWYGYSQTSRLGGRLNFATLTAGTPIEFYNCHVGAAGNTVLGQGASPARRALMQKVFAGNWSTIIFYGSQHTNDAGSGGTPHTAGEVIAGIVDEVDAARTYAESTGKQFRAIYRTMIDRGGNYGAQITGGQAEFNAKRSDINTFLRAMVYPDWHAKAGQKLLDGVVDAGSGTIQYQTTLRSTGTVLAPGAPNYLGIDGGSGMSQGWRYFAANFGGFATQAGPDAPTSPTPGANDRVHPSPDGADVVEEWIYQTTLNVLNDSEAPVVLSATVNAAGNLLTVVYSDDSAPLLPSSGATGLALSGTHTIAPGLRIGDTTYTHAISQPVYQGETLTLSATGSNITDSAYEPNALEDFVGFSVTNNSTQIAPAVNSVSVAPGSATLAGGASQVFTATVVTVGGASNAVTWTLVGPGSITPNGLTCLYVAPDGIVDQTQSATIRARSNFDNNQTDTSDITVSAATAPGTVATPTFSPVADTYEEAQDVEITSATSGAAIKYRLGTSGAWLDYTTPVSISASGTLQAYATKAGLTDSAIASSAYVINIPDPEPQPGGAVVIRQVTILGQYPQLTTLAPWIVTAGDTADSVCIAMQNTDGRDVLLTGQETALFNMREVGADVSIIDNMPATLSQFADGGWAATFDFDETTPIPAQGTYEITMQVGGRTYPRTGRQQVRVQGDI